MKYVRCWTMKGVVIVQNALQGLETERKELMKGTKDINAGFFCPLSKKLSVEKTQIKLG